MRRLPPRAYVVPREQRRGVSGIVTDVASTPEDLDAKSRRDDEVTKRRSGRKNPGREDGDGTEKPSLSRLLALARSLDSSLFVHSNSLVLVRSLALSPLRSLARSFVRSLARSFGLPVLGKGILFPFFRRDLRT